MKKENFIDEAIIKIKAGNGGAGASTFHREKYVQYGGPSGGNGGDGGSIFFVADKNENTLLKFKHNRFFYAPNGKNGASQNKSGARGKDLFINVPLGTKIKVLNKTFDLIFDGQIFLIQKGGKGGRGNASFKSSKNSAPNISEKGEIISKIDVELNLNILADVGIVGLPNTGKSTFISTISNSKSKIANYQFTTLVPHLGLVNFNNKKFVVADLPGLIKGANQGKGMGDRFLKHLSRTKLILHFIDSSELAYLKNYSEIRKELKLYSKELIKKPEIIVITKIDLIDSEIKQHIKKELSDKEIFFISSVKKEGIEQLLKEIEKKLNLINKEFEKETSEIFIKITLNESQDDLDDLLISFDGESTWELSGKYVEYWGNRIPLTTYENYHRLLLKLKSKKIIDKLKKQGIKEENYLKIKNSPFIIKFGDWF